MSALCDMQEPLLRLDTTEKALTSLAMSMGSGAEKDGAQIVLFMLADHLRYVHEHLYSSWEAAVKERRNKPGRSI